MFRHFHERRLPSFLYEEHEALFLFENFNRHVLKPTIENAGNVALSKQTAVMAFTAR